MEGNRNIPGSGHLGLASMFQGSGGTMSWTDMRVSKKRGPKQTLIKKGPPNRPYYTMSLISKLQMIRTGKACILIVPTAPA